MSAGDEVRVVLVKPGDVLVFGNVDGCTPEAMVALRDALLKIGIEHVMVFEADVSMAVQRDADLARDVDEVLSDFHLAPRGEGRLYEAMRNRGYSHEETERFFVARSKHVDDAAEE